MVVCSGNKKAYAVQSGREERCWIHIRKIWWPAFGLDSVLWPICYSFLLPIRLILVYELVESLGANFHSTNYEHHSALSLL